MTTGAVSGTVQAGLLARLVADSAASSAQVDRLTRQSASGLVADTYGGLGAAASVSIDLRPQMAQAQAWQDNITAAGGGLETTQTVLGQLHDIATSFGSEALGVAMQSASGASTVAAQAKLALQQVAGLLNTQANGQYAFAGTDSANPPIDAAGLAAFVTAAGTQVAGLGTGSPATSVLNAVVTAATTAPFAYPGSSATATTPVAVQAETGPGQSAPVGLVAGVNSFAPAAGSATGSYARDLVAGLAALAGLASTTADETTLQTFGAGVSQLLQGAGGAIATEQAGFGQVQANLTTRGTELSDMTQTLTTQVSGAEQVDMAATATALTQVQTQLQASYKLIAGLHDLSLVSYL